MKYVNQEETEIRSDNELEKQPSIDDFNELRPIERFNDDFDEASSGTTKTSQNRKIENDSSGNNSLKTLAVFNSEDSLFEKEPSQTRLEDEDEEIVQVSLKKKIRKQILDDSDSDEPKVESEKEHLELTETSDEDSIGEEKGKIKKKKKIKKPVLDDSDSGDEKMSKDERPQSLNLEKVGEADHKTCSYESMFRDTDLYDAEGSSEEDSSVPIQEHCGQSDSKIEKSGSKGSKKKTTSQRKSKQTALEEIRCETQRLIRHSRISLPYHQPKQRSLSEFLSRRKNVPLVPLKTSSDQLSEVWKSMEEREKIAEEFYKSESDCSEDEVRPSADKPNNSENIAQSNSTNEATEELIIHSDKTIPILETVIRELAVESNQKVVSCSEKADLNIDTSINKPQSNEELSSSPQISEDGCDEKGPADHRKSSETNIESDNIKSSESHNLGVQNELLSEYSEEFKLILLSEKENNCSEEDNLIVHSEKMNDAFGNKLKSSIENSEQMDLKKKRSALLNNTLLDVKLDVIPKISGRSDEIIDLEMIGEKPSALKLVSRFMKHVSLKPKLKKEEKVSVAITEVNEKGEVVNLTEEIINIKTSDTTKPGETRVQLKTKLKQKIAQNREEQFVKRIEEYKLNEEMYEGEKETCSDVEDDLEEEIEPSLSSETESEPEENDVDLTDKCNDKENPFIEEEAEESENEDEEETVAENESEADYSDTESIDVAPLVNERKEISSQMEKCYNSTSANDSDKNELLALCSGVFPSQAVNLKDLERNDSNEPESESLNLVIPEDATLDFGWTEGKSNDDGDDSDDEILKKKPKKKMKLEFSDDEDDENSKLSIKSIESNKSSEIDNDGEISNEENDEDLAENEDENEEEEIIDEEEEEVFQNPSAAAKRFLEDEAELSGSEYGSADEDEVDLDNYEEEQGDNDKINQKKLKDELGKIHMKEILDEDKREIRILQELLLEDGELHSDGPKRQRQFKWYNQGEAEAVQGIFLSALDDDDNDGDGSKENPMEQEDESWRKDRLARENYIRALQNAEDDKELFDEIRKFHKLDKPTSKPSPKLHTQSSPNPKKQFSLITKRGSFLNRGEKLLSKLAEMTNISNENQIGNSRGKKNMVFAVVSPPKEKEPQEQEVKKRKSTAALPTVTKRLKLSSGSLNSSGRKSLFEILD